MLSKVKGLRTRKLKSPQLVPVDLGVEVGG
jgi:hypothetical protein